MVGENLSTAADIANVIIAFLALAVASTSIVLTLWSIKSQERHNRLSLTPIPQIFAGDYEDRLFVSVENSGPGTAIILETAVRGEQGEKDDLISHMPATPAGLFWKTYISRTVGRAIQPGEELFLIELVGDHSDPQFAAYRDQCRRALAKLTVTISYTDVYKTAFDPCSRPLDWFGRHWAKS